MFLMQRCTIGGICRCVCKKKKKKELRLQAPTVCTRVKGKQRGLLLRGIPL